MADHSDEVALTTRLHLEIGEAALGIVEGDALDRARQRLHGPPLALLGRSEHLVHAARRKPGSSIKLDEARPVQPVHIQYVLFLFLQPAPANNPRRSSALARLRPEEGPAL